MNVSSSISAQNLSHEQRESSFLESKLRLVDKIQQRGDLPYISIKKQLELLNQLSEFELGQFLIERGGLNGYWTHYVIHKSRESFHPLEAFLLNQAPTCLATQERFAIFQAKIQENIHDECRFASIPCGLMGDLLELDYSNVQSFNLYGFDLDSKSLHHAKEYAEEKNLLKHCLFFKADAWKVNRQQEFDLITSNGLNIYEPDDEKVIALYRQFYQALKPNGTLITSFLTPPPSPSEKTEWKLDQVQQEHAFLQKILFVDILAAKWQTFRSEKEVRNQLKKAGFQQIEIFYDKAHIFPTVVAKK